MAGFLAFVPAIINLVGGWITHKAEVAKIERQAEVDIKRAETKGRIDYISNKQLTDADWEARAMDASATSWKDEWLTLLFSIPLVMCFVPGLDQYVFAGFKSLEGTPQWYQWSLLVIVGASFGIKKMTDLIGRKGAE